MSSITTSIPTSPISEWRLVWQSPRRALFGGCPAPHRDGTNTVSPSSSSFQSICCNGVIVDTAFDLYNSSLTPGLLPSSITDDENNNTIIPINLSDLICCGVTGVQTAALNLTPSPHTACAPGTASTPLASLAATNASSAAVYPVTYASQSTTDNPSATVTNDLWGWATPTYGASGTPVCLWVNTQSGVSMAEVTVPATYVAPITTSSADAGSAATVTSTSSATSDGFSAVRTQGRSRAWITLGLVALGLFLPYLRMDLSLPFNG
ncbi:hypothetical protein K449DRAFT_389591 [Hypoxylon sp. EC38]|nr:hypothetical protein K449DRAFT_389591 [Hypoxylon sp. EC38]